MATLTTTERSSGCCRKFDVDCNPLPRQSKRPRKKKSEVVDESDLAKEMNALSVQERAQILEEIHGVADENEESPEFITSCLEKMDTCVSKLKHAKRRDLDRAVFLKPTLRKDDKFKLMFLRSENYDAKKAADRMARFFTFKRDLFGDEKLVQKITLQDLDEEDSEIAQVGGIALPLEHRDQAGRIVTFVDGRKAKDSARLLLHMRSLNRFRFHQFMGMLEDETVQKKGIVIVMTSPSGEFKPDKIPTPIEAFKNYQNASVCLNTVPIRISSFHYCYDNPLANFFIKAVRSGFGKEIRLRLRTHFGSATEIRYELRSFGILTDGIIVSNGEEDKRPTLWQHYIDKRREIENRRREALPLDGSRTGTVAYPIQTDVLIGRGRPYPEFPGNQRFLQLIDSEVERYKACVHLFEKTRVIKGIVKTVHDSGGQFLKRVDDGWENAGKEVTMERIRTALQAKQREGLAASSSKGDSPVPNGSTKRLKVEG